MQPAPAIAGEVGLEAISVTARRCRPKSVSYAGRVAQKLWREGLRSAMQAQKAVKTSIKANRRLVTRPANGYYTATNGLPLDC